MPNDTTCPSGGLRRYRFIVTVSSAGVSWFFLVKWSVVSSKQLSVDTNQPLRRCTYDERNQQTRGKLFLLAIQCSPGCNYLSSLPAGKRTFHPLWPILSQVCVAEVKTMSEWLLRKHMLPVGPQMVEHHSEGDVFWGEKNCLPFSFEIIVDIYMDPAKRLSEKCSWSRACMFAPHASQAACMKLKHDAHNYTILQATDWCPAKLTPSRLAIN